MFFDGSVDERDAADLAVLAMQPDFLVAQGLDDSVEVRAVVAARNVAGVAARQDRPS
jgi:hypothetical protein